MDPAYLPVQCTAVSPNHYKVRPYGHSYPTPLCHDLDLTHKESRAGTIQGQNHTLTEVGWHLGMPQMQPAQCRSNQTGLLSTLWNLSLSTTRNALQGPSAQPPSPMKTHLLDFPPDGALSSTAASLLNMYHPHTCCDCTTDKNIPKQIVGLILCNPVSIKRSQYMTKYLTHIQPHSTPSQSLARRSGCEHQTASTGAPRAVLRQRKEKYKATIGAEGVQCTFNLNYMRLRRFCHLLYHSHERCSNLPAARK